MMNNDVEIGGQLVPRQSFEAISNISSNRTLFVQKLNDDGPDSEPKTGLKNLNEVFEHYKPSVSVSFEQEDGTEQEEAIEFKEINDFKPEGITDNSKFLSGLEGEYTAYNKIYKQIKTNKRLMAVLKDANNKQAFINVLKAMLAEIEQAENS